MKLETGVNAKAQRRKDADDREVGRCAKLNRTHLRGERASKTIEDRLAFRLRVFAPLR